MKRAIAMMLSAACLAGCQGCGTSGKQGASTVRVSVVDGGDVSVNGRVIAAPRLAGALKGAGAGPSTAVEVSIPPESPQSVMVNITRELRRAGYTRIVFVRPRQAHVSR